MQQCSRAFFRPEKSDKERYATMLLSSRTVAEWFGGVRGVYGVVMQVSYACFEACVEMCCAAQEHYLPLHRPSCSSAAGHFSDPEKEIKSGMQRCSRAVERLLSGLAESVRSMGS